MTQGGCAGDERQASAPPHRVPFLTGGPPSSTMDRPAPGQGPFPLLRAATPGQTTTGRPGPDTLEHSRCLCLSHGDGYEQRAWCHLQNSECEPRWQPQLEADCGPDQAFPLASVTLPAKDTFFHFILKVSTVRYHMGPDSLPGSQKSPEFHIVI